MPEAKPKTNAYGMKRDPNNVIERMLPAMVAAEDASAADQVKALNRGDYLGALGASARRIVTVPVAMADDVVTRPIKTALSGVAQFGRGLIGSQGSSVVSQPTKPSLRQRFADLAPSTNVNPRGQLKIAPAAAKTTPQEKQLAFLDNVFGGALTLNQATAATAMLPAAGKPQSAKDKLYGDAAAISQQIFANQVKQAEALAGADPAAAKDAVAKATDEYFKRQGGLLGFNPMNLQMADMIADSQDGG